MYITITKRLLRLLLLQHNRSEGSSLKINSSSNANIKASLETSDDIGSYREKKVDTLLNNYCTFLKSSHCSNFIKLIIINIMYLLKNKTIILV